MGTLDVLPFPRPLSLRPVSNARNSVVVNHVRLKFDTSIFGAIIKSLLAKKGIFSMMNFRHSSTLIKLSIDRCRTWLSDTWIRHFQWHCSVAEILVGRGGGGGGEVCRKFESFVGDFGGFVPPPEKVNFRHWHCYPDVSWESISVFGCGDWLMWKPWSQYLGMCQRL
jgi:hypothetical protein